MNTITFLGTGTSQGVPLIACGCSVCKSEDHKDKRLRSSLLIQYDDKNVVIDSGPDFRHQMLTCGIDKLDALLFTHGHKDHLAGLDDVRGFNFRMKEAVHVYCSELVLQQMKREFYYIFEEKKYPGIPEIDIHIIDNSPFVAADLNFQPIEVMHYKLPVHGFRFKDFTYITDANFIREDQLDKIKGSRYLVLNALRRESHISHFTLDEALEIIDKIKPEKAWLTHISHQLGKHQDVMKELPSGVELAYDGLTVKID